MSALQEGIYWRSGTAPDAAFALMMLEPAREASASDIGHALEHLWPIIQRVKVGDIPDLPGHPVERSCVTVLLAYGFGIFDRPGVSRQMPERLKPAFRFVPPAAGGGGRLLFGGGLDYGDDVVDNPAYDGIALQIIGPTELDVHQMVVEVAKALDIGPKLSSGLASIIPRTYYRGFQRRDRRTWIDFHDGISNIKKGEDRERVIKIKSDAEDWTRGGTYLTYLRLAVDVAAWQGIPVSEQEILVGRTKLTGCPLTGIAEGGKPVADAACPVAGSREVTGTGNADFREPRPTNIAAIAQSHVQRSNHEHKQDFSSADSLRIYRQGYDFLEPIDCPPGYRAGLNFVSFMDTPRRLLRILTQESWLGRTNFGGDPDNQPPGMASLLTVRAGGIFLVPPVVAAEPFPGASVFG